MMKKLIYTHWFIFNIFKIKILFLYLALVFLFALILKDAIILKNSDIILLIFGIITVDITLKSELGMTTRKMTLFPNRPQSVFFSRIPYTKKEIFILLLTDKFYISLPLAVLNSYLGWILFKSNISATIICAGFLLLAMSHNFHYHRLSVLLSVDLPRSLNLTTKMLTLGRILPYYMYEIIILILGLLLCEKFQSSFPLLVVGIFNLVGQIFLHFLLVENYEIKVKKFFYEVFATAIPLTFSTACVISWICMVIAILK